MKCPNCGESDSFVYERSIKGNAWCNSCNHLLRKDGVDLYTEDQLSSKITADIMREKSDKLQADADTSSSIEGYEKVQSMLLSHCSLDRFLLFDIDDLSSTARDQLKCALEEDGFKISLQRGGEKCGGMYYDPDRFKISWS